MRRLLIVLAVLVACMAPNAAYAQDVSLVDSFTSGVGTWGSGQKEEMDSDSSAKGIESGGLLAAPAESAEDENDMIGQINTVLYNGSLFKFNNNIISPFFGTSGMRNVLLIIVPTAVLLVFMWWGVRKALRILMASFRRGKANV